MELTFETIELIAVSLLGYWIFPKKYQWIILLVSSFLLYLTAVRWYTLSYVIATVLSVYFATGYFQVSNDERRKKTILVLCLIFNFGILAILKYSNLIAHTFEFFNIHILPEINWLPSLAISFYTLQMTSYLLDCYWGTAKPLHNPLQLGLFCIYFPLMTCGPICRYNEFGIDLFEEHRFDYNRVKFGLYRIGWGLVKKLVVSNRLAIIVDQIWTREEIAHGINVWISSALFALQLYTDFSGVIDVFSGISECFGISLPENFKAPFCSKTIQEFWQRWHITLGAWARDYILNPLLKSKTFINLGKKTRRIFGKNFGKKIPVFIAMFIVWFYMGVWHGNSWKYIIGEGVWFWLLIVLSQILSPLFAKINSFLKINDTLVLWRFLRAVRTFFLYSVGALFFRATSLQEAFIRVKAGTHLSGIPESITQLINAIDLSKSGGSFGIILMSFSLCIILLADVLKYNNIDIKKSISESKWYIRWTIYYAVVFAVLMSLSIANQETLYGQL